MIARAAVAAALLAGPAPALELPGPAVLALEEASPLEGHALATGPWEDGALPLRVVEGAVTREVWQVESPGMTTLQLLAPLRAQVEAEGLAILFDCETDGCGGFDFRAGVEVLPPPAMFVDLGDFRYLAAEAPGKALSLLVSRSAGRGFVQVIRVAAGGPAPATVARSDAGPATTPAVTPAQAAALADRLEAEGRVVLGGLAFATGSADLAAGGDADLAALAAWLGEDPARRVAVVGHTDAQGPLDANVALSRRRARAVADRLAALPGVAAGQVEAEGMGYLAPIATNLTPAGREANRRVEAVLLPP